MSRQLSSGQIPATTEVKTEVAEIKRMVDELYIRLIILELKFTAIVPNSR